MNVFRYRIEFDNGDSLVEEAYNAMDAAAQSLIRQQAEHGENIPKIKTIKPAPIATKFMEVFNSHGLHG